MSTCLSSPWTFPHASLTLYNWRTQIGKGSFDADVYSHNLNLNRQQQADSLQRSYVGSGDILAFTPGGGGGGGYPK